MVKNKKIAVIGLGYVGLPLALEFAKKYNTIGFDINSKRVKDLKQGIDNTLEVDQNILLQAISKNKFSVTEKLDDIIDCNIYIITVPTPIDKNNRPLLTPLIKASDMVGSLLKKGDIVIYESTVYPGVTEDECVPVLEMQSNLKYNFDFYVGYSPERINPGDKVHTVSKITKLIAGSTPEATDEIDNLYKSIISAGTFKVNSIKVAEAAKVIENAQRDINIAFVNELSKIFNLLGINTYEVLEAASTKWNFLNFKPGLVGGHCIGVDPYYLAQKAQELGYHPEIILAGRRLNDGMGKHIATETVKLMVKKGIYVSGSKILILGITFKENCPDVRNSKVLDIYTELKKFHIEVNIFDPLADANTVLVDYGIKLLKNFNENDYDAIIIAVSHDEFRDIDFNNSSLKNKVVFDVKGIFNKNNVDGSL
jgi:UDP-N-acetyl-D-galactosamine dehydrogenase